jgi:hypothetical protein
MYIFMQVNCTSNQSICLIMTLIAPRWLLAVAFISPCRQHLRAARQIHLIYKSYKLTMDNQPY